MTRVASITTRLSPCITEFFFYLRDACLVAFVERPLLYAFGAKEPGLDENSQMLADGGLAYAKLLRDKKSTDAVLNEITLDLWGKMGTRFFQPAHNFKTTIVCQGFYDLCG